mgnify:FL=1
MSNNLPKCWIKTSLADISELIFGQSPPSSTYNTVGQGVPFFQGKTEFGKVSPRVDKWCDQPKRIAQSGDILISVRAPVGPTNLASTDCAIGRGLAAIRPIIVTLYVQYYLKYSEHILASKGTGTTFEAITKDILQKHEIVVAPINEQKRIVDKIETLFSDLDKGEALMKQVQQQLRVYRQTVLKAAVTGELTNEWREQNEHRLESGEALLLRIDKLRRESSKGKEVKFLTSNIEKPESLPNDWGWTTVEDICELNRKCAYGVLQPGDHVVDGEILVRVGDINGGKVNFEELKRISKKIYDQYQRTILQGNEVLITLVGAIGRSAVVPESLVGANVARAVGVIPVYTDEIYPQWLSYWFNSPKNSQLLVSLSHEVARKTLNLEDVRRFGVAIPPKEEQEEIVDKVDDIFSQIDALEKWCATELARSEMLRQSILKAAFSGELLPQDPEDEPASELLARIQAERASAERDGNARKSAGRRGRKATA